MKITVFGATGRTGREIVKLALDREYNVVAFVRDPQKVDIENSRLSVVQGELSDRETIKTAIQESDCVLSALGPTGSPSDEELSDGIANILSAMEECGVKRFIVLSTTSAQDLLDRDGFRFKMRRDMIKRGRPTTYEQIVKYSQLVRDSNSDWTLVRIASLLTNKPLSKHVRAGYLGKDALGSKLSRADLAWFMLEQIDSTEYIRKAPAVSN
ncbi:NAD(P)-dependent oxidoreductase [Methanomassiliicoccus luminyensis]|uniref:NAD(P)-dependent oxidoreductase n=1 Tax=Methanomassiliicoccus luminyensis TaxID=1080712 RepID=UPI0003705E48|nr:SDR family oxidoreductase [Methanomassiliicoccus luminyensis]